MKKQLISLMGVLYVSFAILMASSGAISTEHGNRHVEKETVRVGEATDRSDGNRERVPGYSDGSDAERTVKTGVTVEARRDYTAKLRSCRGVNGGKTKAKNSDSEAAPLPVNYLMMFTGDACWACKKMKPEIKKLQDEGYTVVYVRYETTGNDKIFKKFGVKAMPTFIIFESRKEIKRLVGVIPVEKITEYLKKNEKDGDYDIW